MRSAFFVMLSGVAALTLITDQIVMAQSGWTARESNRFWYDVASSADGTRLVAVVFGGQIYTSGDRGVTWTARESNRQWTSVASSADGTRLVAVVYEGGIYISEDSGVTWSSRGGDVFCQLIFGSGSWTGVASSADGTRLVAVESRGQIYTTLADKIVSICGSHWTERESDRLWRGVASSADGTRLAAVASGGQIYTSSDSGVTWTARESNRLWYDVTSSADGNRLVAVVNGGQIYTSGDSGVTWTARESDRFWHGVASSADGTRLVAVVFGGQIYTRTNILSPVISVTTGLSRVAGSAGSSSTIATVSDAETYAGSLTVTVVGGSTSNDVTISAISNTNGTITASLIAACGPARTATFTLQVSDESLSSTATLTVAVSANTVPVLGYAATSVNVGGTATISPMTGPSDNGTISTIAVQGTGTYTGTVTVNSSGVVSISGAAPAGTHTITISATDNCGATTDATISLQIGGTWIARESDRYWQSVASSADGTRLVAVVDGGQIYTSSDSGVTWTARESNRRWRGVASSADGTMLVAVEWGGKIYTSSDSGVTWTARESDRRWRGVASSADGTMLVAVPGGGQIYTSSDSGVTWTARASNRAWESVASSADGTRLVAVDGAYYGGQIYTSSDSGVTWTARESNQNWTGVASSADGTRLVAVPDGGQIYTSSDSGVTWIARASNRNWRGVASSADGTELVAVEWRGQIYTYTVPNFSPVISVTTGLSRVAGSAGSSSTIATVSDAETYAGSLTVTVVGGSTSNDVTISAISNTNGTITASLIAACGPARTATFTLQVSDGSLSSTATLTVAVSANTVPVLGYAATSVNVGGTATISPMTGPSDNGTISTIAVQSPGTYTGTVTVNSSGVVSISGAAPAGTHTITIRATDNCGATTDATISLQIGGTNRDWQSVASSEDGTRLVAVAFGGQIYTSSDSGVTWTARESNRIWYGVTSSADGTRLVAVAWVGKIYTSGDSGVTWTAREINRLWRGVASSADGTRLVAVEWGGQIYTYTVPNLSPVISVTTGLSRVAGSTGSSSTIATVSDAETYAGSLTVTVVGGSTSNDVTISAISNTNGTITASLIAACGPARTATFTLQVSDGSLSSTATLTVAVSANTVPVLGYAATSVNVGGTATISPMTGPSDNGTISTIAVQSPGTSTGTVTVNSSGVVSISGAAPAGTHTITIRATDNCGATTDATISLTVKAMPTITAASGVARVAGSTGSSSTIATVSDAETSAGSLMVTVTTANPANGVTISNIANSSGTITADIVAATGATSATFTLRVSDGTATATLNVTVTPAVTADPPTVGSQPGGGTGPGGTLTVAQKLTNPSSAPTTMTYVASLPAGLTGVSCSAPLGTCVIGAGTVSAPGGWEIYRTQAVSSPAATSTVTWTGAIPGNSSVTISYVVQVGAVATSGTQYQITSTINGFPGPSVTVKVSATPVGPGDPIGLVGQAAGQKPGSVLIYNLYSSGFNPQTNDSRISITNTSPTRRAYVHFFFIDGSNCSVADMTITLTANQTTSFLASDFDPGVTGYLIAVATDANGCPAIQNDLIGESLVRLESGHRAALPALGVAALGLGGPTCNPNATTATLAFDGLSYNALPRALAVSGLSSIANGFSSLLVVNRIGGNLGTGAATLGSLFGLLYDDQEMSQSFTLPANVCQLRGVLGNNFPRTAPRYTTVIPAGRSGWMRFAAVADEAITGAVLVEAQNGLGGGHNLHHLTTTSTATLTIPVYPAR